MDKLRLRYSKAGKAAFISHLDLMRTMQRAYMRAGLPLKYSEGFNPHAQISIALPLSVGCESVCELMDFSLIGDYATEEIRLKLCAVLPCGIEVFEVYVPERRTRDIKWLKIEGRFEHDLRPTEETVSLIRGLFSGAELKIMKKTKRGEALSDIKPAIKSVLFTPEGSSLKIDAVISAQEPTLNPELLSGALKQLLPEAAPEFASYKRIETLDRDMRVFR